MSQNFTDNRIYNVKAKLAPLPHERRERGWINCQKYIIDLTSCSMYRHFSSMCKWCLLFVNDNFVEKQVLKTVNWIYILLGKDHLDNIFAEVITIKTLFASAKPSAIANCWGEFWGLYQTMSLSPSDVNLFYTFNDWDKSKNIVPLKQYLISKS